MGFTFAFIVIYSHGVYNKIWGSYSNSGTHAGPSAEFLLALEIIKKQCIMALQVFKQGLQNLLNNIFKPHSFYCLRPWIISFWCSSVSKCFVFCVKKIRFMKTNLTASLKVAGVPTTAAGWEAAGWWPAVHIPTTLWRYSEMGGWLREKGILMKYVAYLWSLCVWWSCSSCWCDCCVPGRCNPRSAPGSLQTAPAVGRRRPPARLWRPTAAGRRDWTVPNRARSGWIRLGRRWSSGCSLSGPCCLVRLATRVAGRGWGWWGRRWGERGHTRPLESKMAPIDFNEVAHTANMPTKCCVPH